MVIGIVLIALKLIGIASFFALMSEPYTNLSNVYFFEKQHAWWNKIKKHEILVIITKYS